jgi:hypothetical protein
MTRKQLSTPIERKEKQHVIELAVYLVCDDRTGLVICLCFVSIFGLNSPALHQIIPLSL